MKRFLLVLLLLATHAGAAGLGWWAAGLAHQAPRPEPHGSPLMADDPSQRLLKAMRRAGATDAEARKGLAQALRASESLAPEDRDLVRSFVGDDVPAKDLMETRAARDLAAAEEGAPLHGRLVSGKYREAVEGIFAEARPSAEQVVAAKRRVKALTDAFLAMRKASAGVPAGGAGAAPFLEMLRDLSAEPYEDIRSADESKVPLFNDREGRSLKLIGDWLNSPAASRGLPPDQFGALYREGRVPIASSGFRQLQGRIGEAIDKERAASGAAPAYAALKAFFAALAAFGA